MQDPASTDPAAAFGAHIRSWRMILGLTAKQLAELAGITRDTLSRLELGKGGVGFDIVLAVTGALGQQKMLIGALDPLSSELGRAKAHLINRRRAR